MDLTQMTISCLSNKKSKSHQGVIQSPSRCPTEVLFYKPRLFKLTNRLLNSDVPTEIWNDVVDKYNMYIESCILYFKSIDTHNIIQEEHDLTIDDMLNHQDETDIPPYVPGMYMEECKRPVHYNMTNFVIKTSRNRMTPPPRFKDVVLSTSDLRYKDCGPDSDILINEDEINQHSLDVILPYKYFISPDDK